MRLNQPGLARKVKSWKAGRAGRVGSNSGRDFPELEMCVGIHSEPVIAGMVGVSKFQYDTWGYTVNIASRMETACKSGKVNIHPSTYALIKEDPNLAFEPRGKVHAKGEGEVEIWFVGKASARPRPSVGPLIFRLRTGAGNVPRTSPCHPECSEESSATERGTCWLQEFLRSLYFTHSLPLGMISVKV